MSTETTPDDARSVIYLERIDRSRRMARYYRLSISETLFGDLAVVREWGRIGRSGQSREEWCTSMPDAVALLEAHRRHRLKRGYSEKSG